MQSRDFVLAIAKVIAVLELDNGISPNSFDFKIIVQKVGYMLQRLGCDMGLKFSWYPLGPYSRSLQNHYSVIAKVLTEIRYGSLSVEVPKDVAPCVERAISFLTELKEFIGGLDVKSLEVLAGLAMLCSEIYPRSDNPVEELLTRKRGVPDNLVKAVWRFLVDKNICVG